MLTAVAWTVMLSSHGLPKPIAHASPAAADINHVRSGGDVVGLFSGAAIDAPVIFTFEFQPSHESVSFFEGPPTAATAAAVQPIPQPFQSAA